MTVELRPMPAARLSPWSEWMRREYVRARVASGDPGERAEEHARTAFAASFPDGSPAPGHLVFDVVLLGPGLPDEIAGYLWISPVSAGSDAWWVQAVEIAEDHRGSGHGRAVMELAERTAAEHGATTLGLNVYAYNEAARHLYDSLGYEMTSMHMRKTVRP